MLSEIRAAIVSTMLFTFILGLAYPLAVTGVAQAVFPYQANGSLVTGAKGQVLGSGLIAQPFARAEYLHPRPSAAGSNGYDPTSSGGSNYGPLSADLAKRVASDAAALRKSTRREAIPDDAITTSGSGLDPDISPAYAELQADRIARARGVSPGAVRSLIDAHIQGPALGFLGQPRVNVLLANLALDAAMPKAQPRR
ncbi:MAG TPA: potassium-transporting ATPase subunit KdpC [Caulobacteraceae bacterium]|nr:potassium-transporting ATPase subunit KdpC [Caulobacteraceae bacterium]